MSGTLTIVGVGPGAPELVTPAVSAAVAKATDIVGYETYVNRLQSVRDDQVRHKSPNGFEVGRARDALALAHEKSRDVVIVSGGDPGVFAMAAAVFEAIENGPAHWRDIDVRVEPGVTAMLAAAAHLGAPLGGDFCAISISDNLKSWNTIERRISAAAAADFAIAIYNPASKARPHQLKAALEIVARHKAPDTVVAFVRAAGTGDVTAHVTTLADVDCSQADMRTLVIIGASTTRLIQRNGKNAWVYTPRSEQEGA